MSEKDYPSLSEQGKNLSKFTLDVFKSIFYGQPLFATEEISNQRMSICRSCDKYDESQKRCRECGCMLEHKVKFALDSCPLKKWDIDENAWNEAFDRVTK
jgi:hypothetical protein